MTTSILISNRTIVENHIHKARRALLFDNAQHFFLSFHNIQTMISYSLSKIKENKINPSYNSLISIDKNIMDLGRKVML